MINDRKWCTQRHNEPDVACELKYRHDGMHRAEYGTPVVAPEPDQWGKAVMVAQVVSWE